MARFPKTFRKTMWRKMSAVSQVNALGATRSMLMPDAADAMAVLRGIPPDPAWLKGRPTMDDIDFLSRRAIRRLRVSQKSQNRREAAKKICVHEFVVTPGVRTKACSKCGHVDIA